MPTTDNHNINIEMTVVESNGLEYKQAVNLLDYTIVTLNSVKSAHSKQGGNFHSIFHGFYIKSPRPDTCKAAFEVAINNLTKLQNDVNDQDYSFSANKIESEVVVNLNKCLNVLYLDGPPEIFNKFIECFPCQGIVFVTVDLLGMQEMLNPNYSKCISSSHL